MENRIAYEESAQKWAKEQADAWEAQQWEAWQKAADDEFAEWIDDERERWKEAGLTDEEEDLLQNELDEAREDWDEDEQGDFDEWAAEERERWEEWDEKKKKSSRSIWRKKCVRNLTKSKPKNLPTGLTTIVPM